MSIEANKAAVREWFDAIQDPDPLGRLAQLDYQQYIPGELPISGLWTKDEYLAMMQSVMIENEITSFRLLMGEMTAEGDRVAVEAEMFCDLPDGRVYHNWYHFLFKLQDGHITLVKEYFDMLHILRTFSGDFIHGPAKERSSNIF
ncbi:MAG: hypothetical protein JWN99_3203 [Ilumatobacteraceae bacterium]|nr:hypothetical protein [Ilumatobacteraceae bacterium]